MTPVFLDANIPIYAAGSAHPLKKPCRNVLVYTGYHADALMTSSEVLQEILHFYLARRLWDMGRHLLQPFVELMSGRIEPVFVQEALAVAALADKFPGIQAQDYLHVAVMQRLGVWHIVSADRGFDRTDVVERLDPMDFESWRDAVLQ